MKLRFGDRIVSALLGLLSTLLGVGVVLYVFDFVPHWRVDLVAEAMPEWTRWAVAGVCLLLVILGLRGIAVLFRRRKDRGFVMQRMEYGDMSISMKALENMVRRCVDGHGELKVNSIRIMHARAGVSVDLRITLTGGTNIPLTVNALQKQIKQYITSCSGIDVSEVRVQVETDIARLAPPATEAVAPEAALEEAEPAKHLWQHKEEPQTYTGDATPAAVEEPLVTPVAEEATGADIVEEPAAEEVEIEQDASEPALADEEENVPIVEEAAREGEA